MPPPRSFVLPSLKISSPMKSMTSDMSGSEDNKIGICEPHPIQCEVKGRGANGIYMKCDNKGFKITTKSSRIKTKKQLLLWNNLIEAHKELREKIEDATKQHIFVAPFFVLPRDDIHICKINQKSNILQLQYSVDHIEGISLNEFLKTSFGKQEKVLRELYIQLLFAIVWLHHTSCNDKYVRRHRHNDLRQPNVMIENIKKPFTLTGECIQQKVIRMDENIKPEEFEMKTGYMIKIIDWELLDNMEQDVSNACNENDDFFDIDCAEKLLNINQK